LVRVRPTIRDDLIQQGSVWSLCWAMIVLVDVSRKAVTWRPMRVASIDVCLRG
jgi:hypothetical protein